VVYDYVHGKADWLAAGLPTEGEDVDRPTARDVARPGVPTCGMAEPIRDVARRARADGWDACVVVNDERVVLGLLRAEQLDDAADAPVADVMRPGPSTFRPNVPIDEMAAFMSEHELPSSPITTSDGRLTGLLLRDDALRVAGELHRHEHSTSAEGAR
jgi:CBS domain-containing protein